MPQPGNASPWGLKNRHSGGCNGRVINTEFAFKIIGLNAPDTSMNRNFSLVAGSALRIRLK
jgi:hypothetical protein